MTRAISLSIVCVIITCIALVQAQDKHGNSGHGNSGFTNEVALLSDLVGAARIASTSESVSLV